MKIIVTGGAGFIGSNFIYYELAHSDDQIICLDKLTYAGDLETLAPIWEEPRFSFVRGDIADRDFVYGLFEKEKPDVVVNFAAESRGSFHRRSGRFSSDKYHRYGRAPRRVSALRHPAFPSGLDG